MSRLCEVDVCKSPEQIARLCRIRPQDFDVSNCGVPQIPSNARFVDLYKVFPFSIRLGASGSGTDLLLDEKRAVDANSDFYLHRITPMGSGYKVRFQWPNGHYSSNALQAVEDVGGVMFTKDSEGATRAIRIPAGQVIGIGLQNPTVAAVNVTLLFEGVCRFYLRNF